MTSVAKSPMSTFGRELFELGTRLQAVRRACTHHCACGAVLSCAGDDRCPVGSSHWTCGACLLDQQDAFLASTEVR